MADPQQQPQEEQPLFSFGVVADAQYAELPDGDTEGRCQRFRAVPAKLAAALAALAARRPPLELVLHMGDIVNGNPAGQAQCDAEFDLVAGIFDQELVGGTRMSSSTAVVQAACLPAFLPACPPTCPSLRLLLQGELPAVHIIGNHCLSVPRAELLRRLRIPGTCYSSRRWAAPAPGSPGGGSGWAPVCLISRNCCCGRQLQHSTLPANALM